MSEGKLIVAVVEDDPDFRALVVELLKEAGAKPVAYENAEAAIEPIRDGLCDAVLSDYELPGKLNGEAVVREARAAQLPIAIMSVVDSVEIALRLMRLGANDFVVKPIDPPRLLARLKNFIEDARRLVELRDLALIASDGPIRTQVLGHSRALGDVLRKLPRAAKSGASVLIVGESGTGKELIARSIHDLSRRASAPFVAVDCASIPESLFENELFGHRRGAYSDAREDSSGLVGEADRGTLFLDEAGELPLTVQAKLLRFLQTKEYRRLGETAATHADVRIIAATNRNLAEDVHAGLFREDLFFRLDVIQLVLPPLRERREDIPLLAHAFLEKYAKEFDSPAAAFSPESLEVLVARDWPGNVRELENVVQRAVAMTSGKVILPSEIGSPSLRPRPTKTNRLVVDESIAFHDAKSDLVGRFEKAYASQLLRVHSGNVSAAARAAGLDRKSLARLLTRHGLTVADAIAHDA